MAPPHVALQVDHSPSSHVGRSQLAMLHWSRVWAGIAPGELPHGCNSTIDCSDDGLIALLGSGACWACAAEGPGAGAGEQMAVLFVLPMPQLRLHWLHGPYCQYWLPGIQSVDLQASFNCSACLVHTGSRRRIPAILLVVDVPRGCRPLEFWSCKPQYK